MSQKVSRTRLRENSHHLQTGDVLLWCLCLCPLHSVERNHTSVQQRGCKQRANYAVSPPEIHGNSLMIHHSRLACGNEKQRSHHWHETEPTGGVSVEQPSAAVCVLSLWRRQRPFGLCHRGTTLFRRACKPDLDRSRGRREGTGTGGDAW